MTDHPNHPAGRGLTANWQVNYDDYRRAIALQAHYTNRFGPGIDLLLTDAAEHRRTHQLIIAMLDLNEALMPALGEPEIALKMSTLAAHWAGEHDRNEEK